MITHEENRMLTGVSPGTPLHEPLARYWYPICRGSEVQDRRTRKVRLLGRSFVLARAGAELIALDEMCPHRQASLTLARVEDGGLRCIYHGWLMNRQGRVVEAPNERETGGRQQAHIEAPAVREAGGLVWMNICADESQRAPFPDFKWLHLPPEQVVIVDAYCASNWVQSLEGAIDSSHSSHLHSDEIVGARAGAASTARGAGAALQFVRPSTDRHPRIRVRDTDCGFIYGAIRTPTLEPDRQVYIRATAFAFPAYVTFPSSDVLGDMQIFVPMDEGSNHFFYIRYSLGGPLDHEGLTAWSGLVPGRDKDEDGYLHVTRRPDWGQDREAMAAGRSFTGLRGVNLQDLVVQESMGPIVDRTKENLGAADLAIVHFRRLLLDTARGGAAADPLYARGISYASLVARDGLVPLDQPWFAVYRPGEVQWAGAS